MSPSNPRQPGWTCGSCGSWNESTRRTCRNCSITAKATGQPRRRREISDESREVIRRSVAAAPRLAPGQIATLRAIFQGGAAENPQRAA